MTRVYKVGGPALEDPELLAPLARDIQRVSTPAVLVHGGGRHVDRMLRALGIESRFVDGRRETSPAAMEVVEMILSGVVNKALASGLTRAGLPAVGISGRDAGLLQARLEPGLGRVGTPEQVDVRALRALWADGLLPVVSPVANGPAGESTNVNADEAAFGLARAVQARSLVYLSDVEGVEIDGRPVEALSAEQAQKFIAEGVIRGGMALKVQVALLAAAAGVGEVVIAGRARLVGGFEGTRLTHAPEGASREETHP
jgi:acetylglutamate kinase